MKVVVISSVLAAVILAGCTLLLPTQDLITPCTVQDDCEEGFVCDENACLPEDDGSGSG